MSTPQVNARRRAASQRARLRQRKMREALAARIVSVSRDEGSEELASMVERSLAKRQRLGK